MESASLSQVEDGGSTAKSNAICQPAMTSRSRRPRNSSLCCHTSRRYGLNSISNLSPLGKHDMERHINILYAGHY